MDVATVLVLILSACVIALLAWFEINSRRNGARMKSLSGASQLGVGTLIKKNRTDNGSDAQRNKAA